MIREKDLLSKNAFWWNKYLRKQEAKKKKKEGMNNAK